jgi:hypothetical protein
MALSFGAWLIVLGILGASSLIIAKKPNAKELIAKLAPYQGWIGALSVFYGFFELFSCITGMGVMAVHPPFGLIYWLLFLASSLLQLSLGLILGVGVMKTFIKNEQAHQKMDQTLAKLSPFQGVLGLAAIGVGVAYTIFDILFL